MTITFHHPPTGTVNPFKDFTPGNIHHYPDKAGVYIFGLKIPISGIIKFVPIYVGIAKNLRNRLWQHYCEERTGGNSKWYVFDYASIKTGADVVDLYNCMRIADSKKRFNKFRFSEKLIWFNDSRFFDWKLGINGISGYVSHSGVLASILPDGDLNHISIKNPSSNANNLKSMIENSKSLFDQGFYFAYSCLSKDDISIDKHHPLFQLFDEYNNGNVYMNSRKNGPGKNLAERIELAAKSSLATINIYTSAKAVGEIHKMEIDLQEIQNELVNVGGHAYNVDSTGNYVTPLILKK
jgi:hypothetical protein